MNTHSKPAPVVPGQRFERLIVIARDPERSKRSRTTYWRCLCDCGNECFATGSMLRAGQHKSCGCLRREQTAERSTTHGNKPRSGASRTYNSWMNMLRRCEDRDNPRYPDWGGRGITVCERWHDFTTFLADMGERPPGMTIDRKDNDGPYCPENCIWSTPASQRANSRHPSLTPEQAAEIRKLRANGLSRTETASRMGVAPSVVSKIAPARTGKLTPGVIRDIKLLEQAGVTRVAIAKRMSLNRHTVARALWDG